MMIVLVSDVDEHSRANQTSLEDACNVCVTIKSRTETWGVSYDPVSMLSDVGCKRINEYEIVKFLKEAVVTGSSYYLGV
jgi:hypothetical protein